MSKIGLTSQEPTRLGLGSQESRIGMSYQPTQVIPGGGSTANPFVTTKDNLVQFFCSTLKQLERIMIQTSAGLVRFTITFDEFGAYHLAFSENSPAAVAGVEIEDDSAAMYYDDYIFVNRLLTLPEGWTVSAVFFDNTENLLDVDNGWRLMDLQSTTKNLAEFFGLPEALPEIEVATEQEVNDINDDVMGALYGYGKVTVTIHSLMRTGAETTQDLASVIYVDPEKTWAENGYPTLYDDEGNAIDTTTNPAAGDEVFNYQIQSES